MPAQADAHAYQQAQYPIPAEPDNVADYLVEQVLAITIADEGPDVALQPSRLWTPQMQFQMMRPPLKLTSNATILSAIVDTFQRTSATVPPPTPNPIQSILQPGLPASLSSFSVTSVMSS